MSKYVGRALTALLGIAILAVAAKVEAAKVKLAENGQTDYVVVMPDSPSTIQQTAASELQSFFKESTGADLPAISESQARESFDLKTFKGSKLIVLGPSSTSRAALAAKGIDESAISYDGIILKSIGDAVILSGSPKRGPLYAVYEFLEKKIGCRWWTADESFIPRFNDAALEIENDLDVFYAPKLVSRESYYRGAFDGVFAARSKCNGNGERIPAEYGGRQAFQYFVHSSFPLIPPQKYFLDHPDWFSEIDGVRKVGYPGWAGASKEYRDFEAKLKPEQISSAGTQLCFSSDEMIAELVKNAREALRKNPDAAFLSVSQNDWRGFCTCEKCRAADEEDESHAGSLLRGVNKVAEALEEEFPNLYVETLAYQYTRKPPKVTKPRKNVVIRLCSIECSFAQPLNSEVNGTFRDDLVGWSKIADNLFVWDYATDFALYLLPFPNYRVIAPNLRFYVDHNVIGFFEQGDYQCETGDFVQMRNWIVSKLLWDQNLDPDALRDEFIAGYYAPELVPIYRDYFNLLSDAVEKKNYYLGIYKTTTNGWLDLETLNAATALQKKALETAKELEKKDPVRRRGLVNKVRREQIPLDLVWLQEYRSAKLESQMRDIPFAGPENPLQAAKDFVNKLDEFGLTRSRESESHESFLQFKKDLVSSFEFDGAEASVPDICKDLPNRSWVDLQEFDFHKTRLNEWVFVVDDPNASNGRAIKMPGNHFEWALSWTFSQSLAYLLPSQPSDKGEAPTYHVYAYVRADASTDEGSAMTLGVYDEGDRKGLLHKNLAVSEIKGNEYKLVDLGVVELKTTQYAWFAPPKRPGEVEAVYVDRLTIVREK